jgi:hypothetical protein
MYPDLILSYGPPVLTLGATDSAIYLIKFRAAAVTGVDVIEVTDETLQMWRTYLVTNYPMLADRYFFANAQTELATVIQKWPQMPQVERELSQHMWAASLPPLLQFIEPVFPAVRQLRAAPQSLAPRVRNDPDPVAAWRTQQETANSLAGFNSRMSNIYLPNLLQAMSRAR